MISWPAAHLWVNHFPVVLTMAGLVTALSALVLNRRALWLHAMGTLTVAGVIVYPVLVTGHRAAHTLHSPWYVTPGVIAEHHGVAMIATCIILLTGAVSGYGWWRALRRPVESMPIWIRSAVLIGAIAGFGTVAYTAYLGGQIIHDAPVLTLPQAPTGLPLGTVAPRSARLDDEEMH
jgi:hypothetical protein